MSIARPHCPPRVLEGATLALRKTHLWILTGFSGHPRMKDVKDEHLSLANSDLLLEQSQVLEYLFSHLPKALWWPYVILAWERARKLHPVWFRRIGVCWLMGKTIGRGLCSVRVRSWDPSAVNWDMWTACWKRSWYSPGWTPWDRLPSPAVNDSTSFPSAGSVLILFHSCVHFAGTVQSGSGLAVASLRTWLFI